MRELKHHEKILLKKTNFYDWDSTNNLREVKLLRRYYVQNRKDLKVYNKMVGQMRKIILKLKNLKEDDSFRIKQTKILMNKLYDMGVISYKTNLKDIEDKVGIAAFCRRRLANVMFANKYCESVKEAVTFIEQSQVKVGTNIINNPGFIVTRYLQDHITWADGSKIKRKLDEYKGEVDDYDNNC